MQSEKGESVRGRGKNAIPPSASELFNHAQTYFTGVGVRNDIIQFIKSAKMNEEDVGKIKYIELRSIYHYTSTYREAHLH